MDGNPHNPKESVTERSENMQQILASGGLGGSLFFEKLAEDCRPARHPVSRADCLANSDRTSAVESSIGGERSFCHPAE
jgi:hypothetical protein